MANKENYSAPLWWFGLGLGLVAIALGVIFLATLSGFLTILLSVGLIALGVFSIGMIALDMFSQIGSGSDIEDVPSNATQNEGQEVEDANTLSPQKDVAQTFVRYQDAFPTIEEVKTAVANGEVIYYSDHLPLLFKTDEITLLSYNMLGSDSANGFSEGKKEMVGENFALVNDECMRIARNRKAWNTLEKMSEKHHPDILCLQEWFDPKEVNSEFKFNIGFWDDPTFVNLPQGYQFKGGRKNSASYNASTKDFNDTVTLFSDTFLKKYDVKLDADGATWNCINKANPNQMIKVFNGHILHRDEFGLTESKIKRQLTNSLPDDPATTVTSFNVGDFNNRVAPVNDATRQNLTECAKAATCTKDKIQSCASGSGCYQATGTKNNPQFKQLNGTFINPATAELMRKIPPLNTASMSSSQAQEVERIEPVMCIDDHYEATAMINNQTIFDYEAFLRGKLGMEAPAEPDFSSEALLNGAIKFIVLLEPTEKMPEAKDAEENTLYLQKNQEGDIHLAQYCEKIKGDSREKKILKEINLKGDEIGAAESKEIVEFFNDKKKIDSHIDTFFKVALRLGIAFLKKELQALLYKVVGQYDNALKQLLFVRSGATINNDRCLVVVLPKNHPESKQFYDNLRNVLSNEKTILFEENNSWFRSHEPTLINYQISIPLNKTNEFHQAVRNYFEPKNEPEKEKKGFSSFRV